MSLLKTYEEKIIPAIEEIVVNKFDNGGTRQVSIIKQEDGTSSGQNLPEKNEIDIR